MNTTNTPATVQLSKQEFNYIADDVEILKDALSDFQGLLSVLVYQGEYLSHRQKLSLINMAFNANQTYVDIATSLVERLQEKQGGNHV